MRFEWGDALELPYEDASFDAVTVGFGVRNLADLDSGVTELARVLKPGGRLVILEITNPTRPPLSTFFALWFDRLVPLLGTLAGDRDAYTYLPESVKRFPPPAGLALIMDRAGLESIRYTVLAGGIIAIHSGSPSLTRADVPPPVTRVLDAAQSWLPRQMAAVEARLGEIVSEGDDRLASRGRGDARRRRQAVAPDARPALRRRGGRGRGDSRRHRDRAGPHGDARARRRPRRRPASPRPADRRRANRTRDRDGGGRPAAVSRLRGAVRRRRAPGRACSPRHRSASPRASSPSAATRTTSRSTPSATCIAVA